MLCDRFLNHIWRSNSALSICGLCEKTLCIHTSIPLHTHSQIFTVQLKPVFSSPFRGSHSGGNPPLGEPEGSEVCPEQAALVVSGVGAVDRRVAQAAYFRGMLRNGGVPRATCRRCGGRTVQVRRAAQAANGGHHRRWLSS